ncbi:MAG: hypothetical protein WC900_09390 [Oscillospiraceae bacterium]|jgi:hypothetical protein
MKQKYASEIQYALDEKIALLSEFKELTKKMVKADLDALAELMANRQLLIPKIDSCSSSISLLVEEHGGDEKQLFQEIIAFKKPEIPDELLIIREKSDQIEELLVEILRLENKVFDTIEEIKTTLVADMQKMNKGKQVIDYFSSISEMKQKGTALNSLF